MTTTEAAELLGVTRRRVLALIGAGRLRARRRGRTWSIREDALPAVRERTPGWPKGKRRK